MVTPKQRLFAEDAEHDACGIGAVVSIDGKKSRETVDRALSIVEKLEHRAGKDADGETGASFAPRRWSFPAEATEMRSRS